MLIGQFVKVLHELLLHTTGVRLRPLLDVLQLLQLGLLGGIVLRSNLGHLFELLGQLLLLVLHQLLLEGLPVARVMLLLLLLLLPLELLENLQLLLLYIRRLLEVLTLLQERPLYPAALVPLGILLEDLEHLLQHITLALPLFPQVAEIPLQLGHSLLLELVLLLLLRGLAEGLHGSNAAVGQPPVGAPLRPLLYQPLVDLGGGGAEVGAREVGKGLLAETRGAGIYLVLGRLLLGALVGRGDLVQQGAGWVEGLGGGLVAGVALLAAVGVAVQRVQGAVLGNGLGDPEVLHQVQQVDVDLHADPPGVQDLLAVLNQLLGAQAVQEGGVGSFLHPQGAALVADTVGGDLVTRTALGLEAGMRLKGGVIALLLGKRQHGLGVLVQLLVRAFQQRPVLDLSQVVALLSLSLNLLDVLGESVSAGQQVGWTDLLLLGCQLSRRHFAIVLGLLVEDFQQLGIVNTSLVGLGAQVTGLLLLAQKVVDHALDVRLAVGKLWLEGVVLRVLRLGLAELLLLKAGALGITVVAGKFL